MQVRMRRMPLSARRLGLTWSFQARETESNFSGVVRISCADAISRKEPVTFVSPVNSETLSPNFCRQHDIVSVVR
eukprot:49894-Eustigmatos_ZCMA.PRE.1